MESRVLTIPCLLSHRSNKLRCSWLKNSSVIQTINLMISCTSVSNRTILCIFFLFIQWKSLFNMPTFFKIPSFVFQKVIATLILMNRVRDIVMWNIPKRCQDFSKGIVATHPESLKLSLKNFQRTIYRLLLHHRRSWFKTPQ